jgi:cell division initiation protein
MKLTPLDIRHKEFKRSMRGYHDVEVDEFLDEVADEFERLFKENIDLRDRLEVLEDQVAGYRRIEETLQKTLVSAQASADELKQNSTREAQLIVNEAELQARRLVNEAYSERQGVEQATARLRGAEQDFRFKFRALLQGYLQHLDEQQEAVAPTGDEAAQADFAARAEAVKQAIAREEGAPAAAAAGSDAAEASQQVEPVESQGAGPHAPVLPGPDEVTAGHIAEYIPPFIDERRQDEGVDAAPQAPAAGPTASAAPVEGPAARRDRVTLGETGDLLADVDTGANEHEFKW